ncbi:hypothetical protein B0H10DRAFT_2215859 [Mycena sp. CBHHK59/15]|nr:hypothetical protein B0H10DRAFT_2215859 [Mycena sp. CBHHK59/15]
MPETPPRFDDTGLIPIDELNDSELLPPSPPSNADHTLPHQPDLLSPERLQRSIQVLEARSHDVRLGISADEQAGKGTDPAYARHVRSYESWWALNQASRVEADPSWKEVPAHPITVTKVTLFLEYETTREKKKRGSSETQAGTTVGKSQVLQVISAHENYRINHQHLNNYKNDPEARVKLRDDTRIRTFESAAKHNEPKRAESAQTQKAAGSTVGQ